MEKRDQAVQRQLKYKALTPLKKEIENTERKIELLESEKTEIERDLSDPELYKDGERTKQLKISYRQITGKLENEYKKWTELHEKFENLEKDYEN